MPEEYVVVIQKTKVGDPTVAFQFNMDQGISNLGIKLGLQDNKTGKDLPSVIDTKVTIPDDRQVLLMAPFTTLVDGIPENGVGAKVVFSLNDDRFTLGSEPSGAYHAVYDEPNTFEEDLIDLVPDEALGFTPPSKNESKFVAIQSITAVNDKAFFNQTTAINTAIQSLFSNLDDFATWTLANVGNEQYTLTNKEGLQLEYEGINSLTIQAYGEKSATISLVYAGISFYLGIDINSGGTLWTTSTNNESINVGWYFHDLTDVMGRPS